MNPSRFEVKAGDLEGVRAIAVRGELDLSNAPELKQPLDQALANGNESVLIDLCDCEFIDSTGIAVIVRAWQRLEAEGRGRRLAICSSNDQVRRVLDVTGLELSIPIHGTREEATAALRG